MRRCSWLVRLPSPSNLCGRQGGPSNPGNRSSNVSTRVIPKTDFSEFCRPKSLYRCHLLQRWKKGAEHHRGRRHLLLGIPLLLHFYATRLYATLRRVTWFILSLLILQNTKDQMQRSRWVRPSRICPLPAMSRSPYKHTLTRLVQ